MNFHFSFDSSPVNDNNHMKNLYKHMDRSANKYDIIKSHVFVKILKQLNPKTTYKDNTVHIVIEADYLDAKNYEINQKNFKIREQIEQKVLIMLGNDLLHFFDDKITAMTVVSGAQPDGSYIAPCLHIMCEPKMKSESEFDLDDIILVLKNFNDKISQY